MNDKPNISELLDLTTEIVSAHTGNNTVDHGELSQLIQDVYKSLADVGTYELISESPRPAVPVKKSIFPDYNCFKLNICKGEVRCLKKIILSL